MKVLIPLVVLAALVSGCKLNGQHLGNFKTDCYAKNGVLTQTGPSDYECKLPDGTVLKSR